MKDQQKSVEQQIAERSAALQQEKLQQEEVERQAGIAAQARIAELQKIAQENPSNIETVQKIIEVMDDPLLAEALESFLIRLPNSTRINRGFFRDKIVRRVFISKVYPEVGVEGVSEGRIELVQDSHKGQIPYDYFNTHLAFSLESEKVKIRLMVPILQSDATYDQYVSYYEVAREFDTTEDLSKAVIHLLATTDSRDLRGFRSIIDKK